MSEQRSEKEIIDEAYSDEAAKTWRAPVQGYPPGIPWPLHLEAYSAYCKRWSKQTAMIDLKGRHCRGGFGTAELDELVPGWIDRVSYIGRLEARIAALEANQQVIETLRAALEKIRDGYGRNHTSRFAFDAADMALTPSHTR